MSACDELVEHSRLRAHLVALYEADKSTLALNAGRFLCEGAKQGDALLVVATPEHRKAFTEELDKAGVDSRAAVGNSDLVMLDAHEVLAQILVDGHPSAERFDTTVADVVRRALGPSKDRGVRVYGELVGVLWSAKQFHAAIYIEGLWNKLQRSHAFSLFCGYPIDVFDRHFETGALDALLCAHTRVLPLGTDGQLERAVQRAISACLGHGIAGMALSTRSGRHPGWAEMPKPEAAILWLRKNFPKKAGEVLSLAREYYRAG